MSKCLTWYRTSFQRPDLGSTEILVGFAANQYKLKVNSMNEGHEFFNHSLYETAK
jgi:hypothetical protein